jgi:hypothetical protein
MKNLQGPLPNLIPPNSTGMTGIQQESQGHDKDLPVTCKKNQHEKTWKYTRDSLI